MILNSNNKQSKIRSVDLVLVVRSVSAFQNVLLLVNCSVLHGCIYISCVLREYMYVNEEVLSLLGSRYYK